MKLKDWKTTVIGSSMIVFGAFVTLKGYPIEVSGAWLGGGIGLICAKDGDSRQSHAGKNDESR